MTVTPDKLKGMTKKNAVSVQMRVNKAGDALETAGVLFAAICVILGLVSIITTESAAPFLGVPFGVLLMIAGHTKKTATAAVATFMAMTHEFAIRD